jgi:hypothetical protein
VSARGPIAWVGEDSDHDDELRPVASGVFSAHVEDEALPEGFEMGPQGVPVEVALQWARDQARRVVVRYFAPEGRPSDYAAGAEQPWEPRRTLPRWPPDELDLTPRRMPGHEYLDRLDDASPIDWDVGVDVFQGSGAALDAVPVRLAEAIEGVPAVVELEWVAGPGGGPDPDDPETRLMAWTGSPGNIAFRARVRLRSASVVTAETAAVQIVDAALDDVLQALAVPRRDDAFDWAIEATAYPAGSWLAAMNIDLEDRDGQYRGND